MLPFLSIYFLGLVVDFFTTYQKGDSLTTFYLLVFGMAFVGGFQVWLRFFAKIRLQTIAAKVREELRIKAMTHLIDLELKWHEKEETGSKLEKISNGAENMFHGANDFINMGLHIISNLAGGLFLFFFFDWKYAIFAIVYSAIYLSGEAYFNKKLTKCEFGLRKTREKVTGKFYESASNLLTVKSLGLKNVFEKLTTKYEREFYKKWLQTRDLSQTKSKIVKSFGAVGHSCFIFLIGYEVVTGAITVGSIVVFYNYFGKLRGALDQVTNHIGRFIKVKTSIGRLMELLREEIIDKENGLVIPKNWKTIEFRNITFKYKDKKVLDKFNLVIKQGEKVGIVGISGAGKSTLMNTIAGVLSPSKGAIEFHGKRINGLMPYQAVAEGISMVPEGRRVFPRLTVLENV